MAKIVVGALLIVICLLAVLLYLGAEDDSVPLPPGSNVELGEGPEPKEGDIVFEMAYRGLESSHDEYAHIVHWGFGHPEGVST